MAFDTIAAAVSAMTNNPPDIAGFSKTWSVSRATKPSERTASSSTSADGRKPPCVLSCTLQVLLPRQFGLPHLGRGSPDRQRNGCGRAGAEMALDRLTPAMQRGKPLHHRQAEAGPLVRALIARVC